MGSADFYIDYDTEVAGFTADLKTEVETRLRGLADYHTDMVGAAVAITAPAKNELPFLYRARIVVYTRPDEVVAAKQDDTIQGALKAALSAVERQIREQREKMGAPWKRNDLNGNGRTSLGDLQDLQDLQDIEDLEDLENLEGSENLPDQNDQEV
jgi:ribosome-associated translation inhibitor RaiA